MSKTSKNNMLRRKIICLFLIFQISDPRQLMYIASERDATHGTHFYSQMMNSLVCTNNRRQLDRLGNPQPQRPSVMISYLTILAVAAPSSPIVRVPFFFEAFILGQDPSVHFPTPMSPLLGNYFAEHVGRTWQLVIYLLNVSCYHFGMLNYELPQHFCRSVPSDGCLKAKYTCRTENMTLSSSDTSTFVQLGRLH